jgi:CcmD family protein
MFNAGATTRMTRWMAVLLIMLGCATTGALAQTPAGSAPQTPAAQEGFVPIDQLEPKEELPAAPLVMAAYAVAWILVFAYVWSLWRRLHKVELEIADVSRRLTTGARK